MEANANNDVHAHESVGHVTPVDLLLKIWGALVVLTEEEGRRWRREAIGRVPHQPGGPSAPS